MYCFVSTNIIHIKITTIYIILWYRMKITQCADLYHLYVLSISYKRYQLSARYRDEFPDFLFRTCMHVQNKKYDNFVLFISRLTIKCAAQKLKNFCSHIISYDIISSYEEAKIKSAIFFYDFSPTWPAASNSAFFSVSELAPPGSNLTGTPAGRDVNSFCLWMVGGWT